MKPRQHRRENQPKRGRLSTGSVIWFCLLLAIPGYALSRFAAIIDWRVLIIVPSAISAFAFFAYRSDKRSAEAGTWRVPEATLHLIELVGGWPGAFLAQQAFRHKTSKVSFQVVFWSIVSIHQFAAIDSLLDWRMSKDAIRSLKTRTA